MDCGTARRASGARRSAAARTDPGLVRMRLLGPCGPVVQAALQVQATPEGRSARPGSRFRALPRRAARHSETSSPQRLPGKGAATRTRGSGPLPRARLVAPRPDPLPQHPLPRVSPEAPGQPALHDAQPPPALPTGPSPGPCRPGPPQEVSPVLANSAPVRGWLGPCGHGVRGPRHAGQWRPARGEACVCPRRAWRVPPRPHPPAASWPASCSGGGPPAASSGGDWWRWWGSAP